MTWDRLCCVHTCKICNSYSAVLVLVMAWVLKGQTPNSFLQWAGLVCVCACMRLHHTHPSTPTLLGLRCSVNMSNGMAKRMKSKCRYWELTTPHVRHARATHTHSRKHTPTHTHTRTHTQTHARTHKHTHTHTHTHTHSHTHTV
jgi:hypothetical protein